MDSLIFFYVKVDGFVNLLDFISCASYTFLNNCLCEFFNFKATFTWFITKFEPSRYSLI